MSIEDTSIQRDAEVEVEVGVEAAEVLPKMKRRITQLQKELGGVLEVIVVDNEPNNQSGNEDKGKFSCPCLFLSLLLKMRISPVGRMLNLSRIRFTTSRIRFTTGTVSYYVSHSSDLY